MEHHAVVIQIACSAANDRVLFNMYVTFDCAPEPLIAIKLLSIACCERVLQSSTDQWRIHFAQASAALHFCRLTAHLYEELISMGVQLGLR